MVERIDAFLPSIVILALVGMVTLGYVRFNIRRWGTSFKSVAWHEEHQSQVLWKVAVPLTYVSAPAIEEVLFRAPLIIAFPQISADAWPWLLASSAVFGSVHWFRRLVDPECLFEARKNGTNQSDDVKSEVRRIWAEFGIIGRMQQVFGVVIVSFGGLLFGYYGITHQSVWVAYGMHAAWNLFAPFVLIILVLFAGLVYAVSMSLGGAVGRRMNWRFCR